MIMDELEQLELEQQTKDVGDYQFADGDLSDFQTEFAAPKQDMGITDEPEGFEEIDEANNGSEQSAISAAKAARSTARFLAPIIDQGAAFGLSLVSKNDIKHHKADKDSLKELERLIAEYAKESGGEIPIWMQILICLVAIYGFQIPKALADRKLNNERLELEKERRAYQEARKNFENHLLGLETTEEPKNGSESH